MDNIVVNNHRKYGIYKVNEKDIDIRHEGQKKINIDICVYRVYVANVKTNRARCVCLSLSGLKPTFNFE